VRFDRRPSVNSAYRPTSSFVRTPHGQLEPVFPSRRTGTCRFEKRPRRTGRIPDVLGPARRRGCRFCTATIVNGSAGARRCARPVRITLARVLGGDIDGAWWPHSASVAAELPQLIGVLHRPLGEIVDIKINWSTTDAAPDLDSMGHDALSMPGSRQRRQRLMVINGTRGRVKLLVIPHLTMPALGLMVLRRAADLPVSDARQASRIFETANRIMRAAQAQSALWIAPAHDAHVEAQSTPSL
jgi:Family of unknown function (DUF5994)